MIKAYSNTLISTCGLGLVHSYSSEYAPILTKSEIRTFGGGIGYNVAGFVKSKECKQVYNWISENYDIVFQSPVKRNRRSGRQFFFIVFKDKE